MTARTIGIALLAALCVAPAFAQDAENEERHNVRAALEYLEYLVPAGDGSAEAERLALHRAGIEAWTRLGDLQARRGRLDAAEQAYREAIRLYQAALAGGPASVPARESTPIPPRPQPRAVEEIGDAEIRAAIDRGLAWLRAHQDDDGLWDCQDFMKHDPEGEKCSGGGGTWYDLGVTGLSLLALLRDDPEAHGDAIARGLARLASAQDEDGCLGPRASQHFIYNHAVGTLALCEGYAVTRAPRWRGPAQKALDWLARARNPYLAWRYDPRGGDNDTSVTGWCVHALFSGKRAGLEVDPDAFAGARAWFDRVTDPATGRAGYNMPGGTSARPQELVDEFPAEKTEAMTASAILGRILAGEDPQESALVRKGLALCLELPPRWNPERGTVDMYYWFHGTLAARRVGGPSWERWRRAVAAAVVRNQRTDGSAAGSWDPVGPWGPDGGRVYATALMVQSLQACRARPD